ncbi:GntR family transcriptional regulator [Blastomonas sp.]|uniref:GntR family transcriptional regulator n=1 Tax=Blastomonas sp. TaxID=1909299 RepID=UPI00406A1970
MPDLPITARQISAKDSVRRTVIEPATQNVLTRLREMIVTGEIPPGYRLRAEALATKLNVSRTPIRSALAVLATEGLVSYSENRGYTAETLEVREILDAIEVRAVLEGHACQLSVDYGWTEPDLAALAETVAAGRRIVDASRWSEEIEHGWYLHNADFHRLIARAANNRVIRNAIRISILYPIFGDIGRLSPAVAAHVPPRLRKIPDTVPEHICESQADHEAILAAIQREDAVEAAALMTAHVSASRDRLASIASRR